MTKDDFMVIVGAIVFITGLALIDWRLAMVACGLLLMLSGMARLTSHN